MSKNDSGEKSDSPSKELIRTKKKIKLLESIIETKSRELFIEKQKLDKTYMRSKKKEGVLTNLIETKSSEIFQEKQKLERNYKRAKAKEDILTKLIETKSTEIYHEKERSESLLHNILPSSLVLELKKNNKVQAKYYDSVSVLFTDFVGFTNLTEKMTPDELVGNLHHCFSNFDEFTSKRNLEKLKTIGDAYMCVGGLPDKNKTHAVDACLTGLKILRFMSKFNSERNQARKEAWDIRIGIHTGPVMAGVIGKKKFAYDIWGDTVNMASRMESHGFANRLNVSQSTKDIIDPFFITEYRGNITVKRKGEQSMYFVNRIRPELSADKNGLKPNNDFKKLYFKL